MFYFSNSPVDHRKGFSADTGRQTDAYKCRLVFITLFAFFSIFVLNSAATAQVLLGSLTGNVSDSSGASVSGAKVEATHLATGQVKTVNANSDGSYTFTDLQIGIYKVVISNSGFRTANNERVEVSANNVTRFDVKLEVGEVNASVDVTSENDVVLQTDRADVNYVHTTRQITDLPLTGSQGRNYQSLLTIVPGAVKDISQSPVANGAGEVNSAAGSPQRSISFNVNGVSRLQNNTRVDGASVIYPWLPTNTAYVPITESIQEVNIVTNSFDAEQGLVGGAFTNVITRSGTNGFHGAGWGYLMNSTIGKSRNYFQTTPQNPKDILAQYGYAIGGPIVKNKLFFFSDLERTTRNNTSRINVVSLAPAVLRPGPNGVDFSSLIPAGTNCNVTPVAGCIFDPASNPDPALRTAFPGNIIPANRISSASAALIALLPLPTGPGFQQNFVASGVAMFERTNFDNKINWTINDRAQMWGKFSYSPTLIIEDPILGAAGGDAVNGGQLGTAPGKVYVFSTGGSYAFSSNVILDWVYGQTLQNLGAEFDLDENYCLDTLQIPGTNGPDRLQGGKCRFSVPGWAEMGNPNTGNPFNFYDKQFTQATNLTWTKGDHSFRFGFDYQKQRINHFQPQGGTFQTVRGTFVFNGTSTAIQECDRPAPLPDVCAGLSPGRSSPAAANSFNGWASFLLGLPSQAGKVDQLRNPNSVYFTSYAVYAKDQWRATRDLTINYGIRWERYLRPDKDTTGINWFNPLDGLIYTGGLTGVPDSSYMESGPGWFLPRIGVAYRWNDKTVLRGGYGSSVDPRPFIDFRNAYPIVNAWSMPAIRFAGADNGFIPVTNFVTGLVNTSAAPDLTQGVIRLPPNTGTTTYPRTPKRDLIHSFNFIFERELPWKFKSTVGYVGTRALGQMGFININASAPGTGTNGRPLIGLGINSDINEIRPYGDATYDSLQATLNRRWSGSNIGVAYTWSKAINYADNDANPRIQYLPEKERNKGLAGYHREHNLQIYGVYDLPFGKGQHWWNEGGAMNLLVGGWQINTIISAMSGSPFSVIQNTAPALQAAGSGQYPDQIASEINILGGVGVGNPYFDRTVLGVNCTANCAWGSVGSARFGTAGRNNLIGPAFYNVDFGLFKTFTITERVKFQLRAEALNLFNHANFANPQGDINNSNFGYITSTVGTGERNIRFAGRLSF